MIKKTIIFGITFVTISCAYSPTENNRVQKINDYIQFVDHLSKAEKAAMKAKKPFIGMTKQEADLVLSLKEPFVLLDNEILYGVYSNSRRMNYHAYFTGSPPKLIFWSTFKKEDVKLIDWEDLRPKAHF